MSTFAWLQIGFDTFYESALVDRLDYFAHLRDDLLLGELVERSRCVVHASNGLFENCLWNSE